MTLTYCYNPFEINFQNTPARDVSRYNFNHTSPEDFYFSHRNNYRRIPPPISRNFLIKIPAPIRFHRTDETGSRPSSFISDPACVSHNIPRAVGVKYRSRLEGPSAFVQTDAALIVTRPSDTGAAARSWTMANWPRRRSFLRVEIRKCMKK